MEHHRIRQPSAMSILPADPSSTRHCRRRFLTAFLSMLAGVPAISLAAPSLAGAAEEITWDDLLPPEPEFANPIDGMPDELQGDLFSVMRTETNIEGGLIPADGEAAAMAVESRQRLADAGYDAARLIDEIREVEALYEQYGLEVVAGLDGRTVRIPGYALPLETSDRGVSEFLLVPYIGACIHTPPPPPSQMILVDLNEPHRFGDIFEAVWLTGSLRVESSSKTLSFVDGAAPIMSGYRLTATLVEPYEW